jgi:predicted  nucleic acid-binding Zn-ribbon protein
LTVNLESELENAHNEIIKTQDEFQNSLKNIQDEHKTEIMTIESSLREEINEAKYKVSEIT